MQLRACTQHTARIVRLGRFLSFILFYSSYTSRLVHNGNYFSVNAVVTATTPSLLVAAAQTAAMERTKKVNPTFSRSKVTLIYLSLFIYSISFERSMVNGFQSHEPRGMAYQ